MKDIKCEERIDKHLEDVFEDFRVYLSDDDVRDHELPPLDEYALCVDVTDHQEERPYIRYQLSWGGPSDEFRVFSKDEIIYVFMDWFDGARRDVSGTKEGQWLIGYLDDLAMFDELESWEGE